MFNSRRISNNNPNPILEGMRGYIEKYPESNRGRVFLSWEYMILSEIADFETHEHDAEELDHARRVLEKLVNVYG